MEVTELGQMLYSAGVEQASANGVPMSWIRVFSGFEAFNGRTWSVPPPDALTPDIAPIVEGAWMGMDLFEPLILPKDAPRVWLEAPDLSGRLEAFELTYFSGVTVGATTSTHFVKSNGFCFYCENDFSDKDPAKLPATCLHRVSSVPFPRAEVLEAKQRLTEWAGMGKAGVNVVELELEALMAAGATHWIEVYTLCCDTNWQEMPAYITARFWRLMHSTTYLGSMLKNVEATLASAKARLKLYMDEARAKDPNLPLPKWEP